MKMKKIISLVLVALLLIPFMGYSRFVSASSVSAARMTKLEEDIPQSIDCFDYVEASSLQRPKILDIGQGWSYSCINIWDNYILTVIYGHGGPFYLVGEFYFDQYEDLFIPFGEDASDIALRISPTENGLIVFGNVIDESEGEVDVNVQPQIVEGNSTAYLRNYKKPFVGGNDYYEYMVIVPAAYSGVQVDVDDLYTIYIEYQGYLPGQNGEIFYLEGSRCKVGYYTYSGMSKKTCKKVGRNITQIYTRIQMLDEGKELWIKGQFLYDAGYQAFYLHDSQTGEMVKTIKFKYIGGIFKISCGGVVYTEEGFIQDEEGEFTLGTNTIGIAFVPDFPVINLRIIDGLPLIYYY